MEINIRNISIIIIVSVTIYVLVNIETCYNSCESCEMYAAIWKKDEINYGVNGYYHSDKFYCVWTKGRTIEEIAGTDTHEKCHALINKSYEHFCGEK